MTDFNILHGLSTELFSSGEINPNLIVEYGYWYLCTDTAELFLGVYKLDEAGLPVVDEITGEKVLTLKKINANTTEQITACVTKLEIVDGSLIATYADGTTADLGKVVDSIPTKVSDLINDAGYITSADIPNVDLEDYALKSELPSVSDFIASIPNKYITEAELDAKGFLTTHQDISGKADKVHEHTEYSLTGHIHEDYADRVHTHTEYAEVTHVHDKYLTEHQSLANYYNKEEVNNLIPSLDGYAKTSDIPSLEGYATEQYVFDAIENHDALAAAAEAKAKLEEEVIPTVEQVILPKVEKIDEIIPTVYTLSDTKADKVLFTTSTIVNNAVGSFEVGEDLKDLTLAQLFVRLLGLSDKPNDNPDEPEIPDVNATPEEIVDYLISTETAMYSQDTQGNLVETAFTSNTWTVSEASVQMDGISTIYHIEDEAGNIIESGYQEATDYNEEAWLTIALPNIITNIEVKMYNPGTSTWEAVNWKIVPADDQTIEGYTIWTVPESYEVMSGDTYRFVIIN